MMKNYISFLLFFSFLCFQAQLKDSLDFDKDGILNIDDRCLGIPGVSESEGCPKDWREYYLKNNLTKNVTNCPNYEADKQEFNALFGDAKFINYEELSKLIIKNIDTSKFDKENLVIYEFVSWTCGTPEAMCDSFEPVYPINVEKIWTGKNIISLQKKIKKNIIPQLRDNFTNSKEDFYEQFKTSNSAKGIMNYDLMPGKEDFYYYFPYDNKKLTLTNELNVGQNKYTQANTFQTTVTNINSKKIAVRYQFLYEEKKDYSQTYEYTNNQWKLIETKTN